jgi:hypothetical protein
MKRIYNPYYHKNIEYQEKDTHTVLKVYGDIRKNSNQYVEYFIGTYSRMIDVHNIIEDENGEFIDSVYGEHIISNYEKHS